LFVFRGRRNGLIKAADSRVTLAPAQLGYPLAGIDWRIPQHMWQPQTAG